MVAQQPPKENWEECTAKTLWREAGFPIPSRFERQDRPHWIGVFGAMVLGAGNLVLALGFVGIAVLALFLPIPNITLLERFLVFFGAMSFCTFLWFYGVYALFGEGRHFWGRIDACRLFRMWTVANVASVVAVVNGMLVIFVWRVSLLPRVTDEPWLFLLMMVAVALLQCVHIWKAARYFRELRRRERRDG